MKIAMLLSGGVDSSVSMRLLKDAGHDVTAFYIKIWLEDELKYLGDCPWEEDLKFARAVCEQASVELQVLSLQKEYWENVVDYTIKELRAGRTPNPDMLCNQKIKFGKFFEHIDDSFEKVATGHYAVCEAHDEIVYLKKSKDAIKDQTYFLAYLSQEQLKRALFPIGHLTKTEVRELAEKFDLPNKVRKDSQGICFLGTIKFSDFVKHHFGEMPGDLVDIATNKKVGEHDGYFYLTIGQRSGIKLSGGPWYVIKKDIEKNIVYIGRKEDLPNKSFTEFAVEELNWISGAPSKTKLGVRIRHTGEIHEMELKLHEDHPSRATIHLQKPMFDLAPGQFAVFYDGDYCLGSGIIAA